MAVEKTSAPDGHLLEWAPAKINLALHITGRRGDGYHALESLVAFADFGDQLNLLPGRPFSLSCDGPFAGSLGDPANNLVMRAATAFQKSWPAARLGAFHLTKNLPLAAGIGGGSSDAAAALRALARLNAIAHDSPRLIDLAQTLGADVPVCLAGTARIMRGIGHDLGPPLAMPPLPAVLVNPGIAVATPAVFAALGLKPGEDGQTGDPSMDDDPAGGSPCSLENLTRLRNDLEAPATRIAPVIATVLTALRQLDGSRLARMSGSGATCFALFDTMSSATAAAQILTATNPAWWVRTTTLTEGSP